MTEVLISLGFVILLIAACAMCRRRQREANSVKPLRAGPAVHPKEETGVSIHVPMPMARDEKAAILETWPVLREIPFTPVQEGLFPVPYVFVDDAVKETLRSKVSTLPGVSTMSLSLLRLLQDPQSNSREVTTLVSTNPAFSAKVLQTVNSAYFNQTEKVTAVGRAITLLGFNNVRSLLVEDMLSSAVPAEREEDPQRYARIWGHSAVVSACAGQLGKSLFQLSEYALATIGLLHDIGKYFFPLLEKTQDAGSDLPAVIREDRQYRINHASIGAVIARKWQLPDIVAETIEHHHAPFFFAPEGIPEKVVKLSFLVSLADLICNVLGYGGQDQEILPLRKEYYERFGLSGDMADLVTPALVREMEKARLTVESYTGTV